MKMLRLVTFLLFAATALAQVPAPQIPLTGNIGPGGVFPLLNSGTISFTDANHTMVYPEMSASFIKVTSSVSLTATRSLVAPLTRGFEFTVENLTTGGQAIQVIGISGTGVTIPNGSTVQVTSDGTNYVQSGGISGVVPVASGGTGATTPYAAATNLGVPQWSVGVGAPSATCSAIANNGTFYTSSTSEIFQCNDVTGTYQWNQLGPTLNCAAASVYFNILCYGGIANLQPSFGYMSFGWSASSNVVDVIGTRDGFSYTFTSADIGKWIVFNKSGAAWTGGLPFTSNTATTANAAQITGVNTGTQLVVSRTFQTTDTAYAIWGTDNVPAANACNTAAAAHGGTCAYLAGAYLFATYGTDTSGNPIYDYRNLAQDSGDVQQPSGGTGATVSCTTTSGHLGVCTVTSGGSYYTPNNTLALEFGQHNLTWLGCPTVYVGPCGGAYATVTTDSSGVVQNLVTIVYQGFGLTGTIAPTVIPSGGDGATATCTLSGGTCGTPSIGSGGGGYPLSSSSFYAIHALNAPGGTCTTLGYVAGIPFVGVGTASSNSSGAISSATWTTAPSGCGSTTPNIVFGNQTAWNAGTSNFTAQTTNLAPLIPPAMPIQVMLTPGVSTFCPTGSSLSGCTIQSVWDSVTVDTPTPGTMMTQPALFGGPFTQMDFGNLQMGYGFVGLDISNNANKGVIHDLGLATAIGVLSASYDLGLRISNVQSNGLAAIINGGQWGQRIDIASGTGGINDSNSITNILTEPAGGAYAPISAAIDTFIDKAIWRSDLSGDAVDFAETCALPDGVNQRQTSEVFGATPGQGANTICYKGVTGLGFLNLVRSNRNAGGGQYTNFNGKYLFRPMFYGSSGPAQFSNWTCEACNWVVSDPWRAESTQEGAMEFSGGSGANFNKIQWSVATLQPILQPLWALDGAYGGAPAGTPYNVSWFNVGAYQINNQAYQNINVQNIIQNPWGENLSWNIGGPGQLVFNKYNGSTVSPTGYIRDGAYNTSNWGIWSVATGTYTSGGSVTGSSGQTCQVNGFNGGGLGAIAFVSLTGTNTIAGGTALSFTAPGAYLGNDYTSNPTTATLTNGSATCSGSVVVAISGMPKLLDFNTGTIGMPAIAPTSGGPNCLQISVGGSVTQTGSPCGSGGGGSYVSTVLTTPQTMKSTLTQPNAVPAQNTTQVLFGDSLGCGGQGYATGGAPVSSIPAQLSSIFGFNQANQGVGGSTSLQIAIRQGAVATNTVGGVTIPAGTTPVTVNFTAGSEPASVQGGNDGANCYGGPAIVGGTDGTLLGVHGTWVYTGSGTGTFTRTTAGSSTVVPGGTQFIVDTPYANYFQVIEAGTNDAPTYTGTASNVSAMLANSPSGGVCLSVETNVLNVAGSANYIAAQNANTAIAAACPGKYVDIWTPMINGYNPTFQPDVLDHANGVVPLSLRAWYGGTSYSGGSCASGATSCVFSSCPNDVGDIMFMNGNPYYALYPVQTPTTEYMVVTSITPNTPVGWCTVGVTRGYAGTTPTTWPANSGDGFFDSVHPNANGQLIEAQAIATWYKANGPNTILGASDVGVFNANQIAQKVAYSSKTFTASQSLIAPFIFGGPPASTPSLTISPYNNCFAGTPSSLLLTDQNCNPLLSLQTGIVHIGNGTVGGFPLYIYQDNTGNLGSYLSLQSSGHYAYIQSTDTGGDLIVQSAQNVWLKLGDNAGATNFYLRSSTNATAMTVTSTGNMSIAGSITPGSTRKGTFICTGGGTITITNSNYVSASDVIITMHTAGGTITTPPAFKTVTNATGFSVLCGVTDTSTYNYDIIN